MTYETSFRIAETIREQIAESALFMLGAKNFIAVKSGLCFKVGRNAKKVTHIRVTLTPADVYRVEFLKCRGFDPVVTIADREGVYADNLCAVIETETGLRTSL